MARINLPASSRVDDTPDLSELMAPFLKSNSDLEGRLTPYKVTVLVLLEQYTTYEPADDFSTDEKRRIAMGFLNLFRSTYRPLTDLKRIVCVDFGSEIMRKIYYIFAKRALETDLDLFISMFYGCIATIIYGDAKPSIKSTSLAGQFARKMFISYKKASFTEICHLWTEFRKYFSNDAPLASLKNVGGVSILLDEEMPSNAASTRTFLAVDHSIENQSIDSGVTFSETILNGRTSLLIPNQREALAFILKQVYLLEYDPSSVLSYSSMAAWIRETRKHLTNLHELYFLEYLNELRIKNLPAAEFALHRYFDCAGLTLMSKSIFEVAASVNRLTGPATSIIPPSAFRSLRYGPLLLADMHRRFGNEEKALAYLHECVKKAEEANDKTCLDYSVALFSMLNCAGRRADYDRLIDQSLKDTEDRNATVLHFRCHLAQLLKHIADCKNAKSLIDVKHLILSEIHEKLPAVAGSGKDRSTQMTERSIKNILRAALSSTYLQRGYWNAARLEARKLINSTSNKTADIDSIAVVNLAYGLAAKGQYDNARKVLLEAKNRFSIYTAGLDRINLAEALINFEIAFLIGDDEECKRNLLSVESLSLTEAKFRKAIYDAARDTFSDAVKSMTEFLTTDEGRNPYARCRALLILGRLFLHRVTNVGIAQNYLSQCQKLAEQYRFAHLAAMAARDLTEAKSSLGVSVTTTSIDEQRTSAGDETWFLSALDTACANLSKARTILGRGSNQDAKGTVKAVSLLQKTCRQLESINAKLYQRQAYALLAIAYQRSGNNEERNRLSKLYRQLHEPLRKSGFTVLIF